MLDKIKKVLARRQAKQVQQSRLVNNRKQIKLILQGLEERGF